MTPHEQHLWDHIFGGGRQRRQTEPPKAGYKNAIRPPWAPPEPPPLQVPPAILPGLVDLAEQAGAVVEVIRCPKCGVFFEDWHSQPVRDLVTISGCSCPAPNVYAWNVARKYGFLP